MAPNIRRCHRQSMTCRSADNTLPNNCKTFRWNNISLDICRRTDACKVWVDAKSSSGSTGDPSLCSVEFWTLKEILYYYFFVFEFWTLKEVLYSVFFSSCLVEFWILKEVELWALADFLFLGFSVLAWALVYLTGLIGISDNFVNSQKVAVRGQIFWGMGLVVQFAYGIFVWTTNSQT